MLRTATIACLIAGPASAESPRVIADFAPIHSLTATVMTGVGTPDLLLPPGTDPHHAALTPSDAGRLADADIVIWLGHGLTPWLEDPIETLAADALHLELLDSAGWTPLPLAEDEETDDHGHDHDHGAFDPHAWLDPEIAAIWLETIATTLSDADPANAATYRANAAKGAANLFDLTAQITAQIKSVGNATYLLPHEGYQYFETRFGLTNAGSIAVSDASAPGPARIAALREDVVAGDVTCVFVDLETDPAWATLLTEGTNTRTAQIDGTGAGLEPGPDAYAAIIQNMANAFTNCLRPS